MIPFSENILFGCFSSTRMSFLNGHLKKELSCYEESQDKLHEEEFMVEEIPP